MAPKDTWPPAITPRVQPIAWRLILGLAGVKLAAHLATDWQYGFQRDELYYLDCARHLAWGFVDFPPVTPLIAFLDQLVLPGSLEGVAAGARAGRGRGRDVRQVGVIDMPYGIHNEEHGRPILACTQPKLSLADWWPGQQHYS